MTESDASRVLAGDHNRMMRRLAEMRTNAEQRGERVPTNLDDLAPRHIAAIAFSAMALGGGVFAAGMVVGKLVF